MNFSSTQDLLPIASCFRNKSLEMCDYYYSARKYIGLTCVSINTKLITNVYFGTDSPPCRSTLMLAKALGVELNLKTLNFQNKEHLTPEFLKLNPCHTVPTLVDSGFAIWESRAILCYLADKYGKDDSLYPKDPQKRAVVNQRLYFDMGTFYQRFMDYFVPQMKLKLPADPEKLAKLIDALEFLDGFLSGSKYAAGDEITIADYALIASFSVFLVSDFDFARFENVSRWYALCKETMPGIELNDEGIAVMKEYVKKAKEQA